MLKISLALPSQFPHNRLMPFEAILQVGQIQKPGTVEEERKGFYHTLNTFILMQPFLKTIRRKRERKSEPFLELVVGSCHAVYQIYLGL